jgi:GT2 family glycosyltransferase
MNKSIKVSIVILNYNTKNLVVHLIKSIIKYTKGVTYEIILVDNGSTDGSVEEIQALKNKYQEIKIIKNDKNLGFARGNNAVKNRVHGKYILFLNSDTLFEGNVIKKCLSYLDKNKNIGALTVKQIKGDGELDRDAKRSFPTPWVAFTHFSGLDRLFPKSKLLAQYWYGFSDPDKIQQIDSLQGSFFLSPKSILDKVGWFDEDYFLDGEDIDLSWKIKNAGYKNVYLGDCHIIHLKGITKGKRNRNAKQSKKERLKYITAGVNSMEIFYRKHLWNNYPFYVNYCMVAAIRMMKMYRIIKLYLA